MGVCIAGRIEEYGNEQFKSCSVDTMPIWPVKGLDYVCPVDVDVLRNLG